MGAENQPNIMTLPQEEKPSLIGLFDTLEQMANQDQEPIQIANFEEFQRIIQNDPIWFVENILGLTIWSKQKKMMWSVRDNMKTLVAGCVSSGKTKATAAIIFWWLMAFAPTSRVFSLAPTERQLKINLWGEIPKIFNESKKSLGGQMMPLSLQYRLGNDWFAMGFSPQDEMGVFGIHGPNDLIVVDDAQGIHLSIWNALENTMASGTTKLLACCNPIVTSGEVFNAMTSNRGEYNVIRISAMDTPNIKYGRIVIPGLITKETVDKWVSKYGRNSNFVRTKVDAKLPKQEPDTLIPLDWIEEAINRPEKQDNPIVRIGVDVARFGDDRTVIFPIRGNTTLDPIILHGYDTMQVTGRIIQAMDDYGAESVYVDVIGIGSGVVDRLKEQKIKVHAVNVGEKAFNEKKFMNLRSELWWYLREALNPNNPNLISLPNNPDLMAELSAVKYKIQSDRRIGIESKDDMKKRLGHSPDIADALCLTFFIPKKAKILDSMVSF
jgi:hypothetical protein